MTDKTSKTLYPIDSFGISKVSLSSIRVDKLEDRLKPTVAFPHKHDFYQLILIKHGTGLHSIDFKPFKVHKEQLFIMKPGQIHTWDLKPQIKGLIIEFNRTSLAGHESSFPHLISQMNYLPDAVEVNNGFGKLETISQLMLDESLGNRELRDMSLRSYLSAFLIEVIRLYGVKGNQQKSASLIDQFRDLIEEHYKNQHRVEFYAGKLKLSSKALNQLTTQFLKLSPREMIQNRFLLEAKRYLAYSDLSISEVGFAVGFEDANYFTRFFRLHERVTPAQFRETSLLNRDDL